MDTLASKPYHVFRTETPEEAYVKVCNRSSARVLSCADDFIINSYFLFHLRKSVCLLSFAPRLGFACLLKVRQRPFFHSAISKSRPAVLISSL